MQRHIRWVAYRATPTVDLLCRAPVAFALRGTSKVVRGLKQGLTEKERYAVADHVVCLLKERGDPWHLGDEAKRGDAPTT